MYTLEHRVRVYVFQVLGSEVQYLLLRQKPAAEWPLGPVIGTVGVGEHLHDTIVREVRAETGIQRPLHILEIAQPSKELFGDMGLIEWPFAYQAGTPNQPVLQLVPGPTVGELAWMNFEAAYSRLEASVDRDSLVRLQLRLQSAG